MGFKLRQHLFWLKIVNEFIEQMKTVVEEAKLAIWKAQENMAKYYNQRKISAPIFYPGDWVFLDVLDIKMTWPSTKLPHWKLRPYQVEQQVGPIAYRLKLPPAIKKLYSMFNMVKLSTALTGLIPGKRLESLPLSIIIDRKKE